MNNKLKAITTKAKSLYKTGKYKKWTDAIKAASKTVAGVVSGKKKTATKKAATKSYHKDSKSHNVNIRVMSGKLGALPIDFKGSFLGYSFSIVNQYTLDGGVTAVFLDKDKVKIVELNGRKDEEARAINILTSRAKANFSADNGYQLNSTDSRQLEQRVKKFIVQLNGEVRAYNSGKDRNVKKVKPVKITYTKTVKKLSLVDEIKTLLKANKKILKGGYTIKPGKIRLGLIGSLPQYKDPDAAREIELFADNDSKLYFSRKLPILKNLQKKYKKGNFDIEKAAKLWRYYIDDAMQRYNKEFGSRGDKWHELLSTSDRQLLALEYAKETLKEFEQGNFYE